MPFGVQRGWLRYALPRPEILSYRSKQTSSIPWCSMLLRGSLQMLRVRI
jgi:hypothetical protein